MEGPMLRPAWTVRLAGALIKAGAGHVCEICLPFTGTRDLAIHASLDGLMVSPAANDGAASLMNRLLPEYPADSARSEVAAAE